MERRTTMEANLRRRDTMIKSNNYNAENKVNEVREIEEKKVGRKCARIMFNGAPTKAERHGGEDAAFNASMVERCSAQGRGGKAHRPAAHSGASTACHARARGPEAALEVLFKRQQWAMELLL